MTDTGAARRMEEASEWLIRLQEDDLEEAQILRWVDWCQAHPDNRRTFERLLPVWQAFDQHAAQHPVTRRRVSHPRRRAWVAIAAALVLVVAGVFGVLRLGGHDASLRAAGDAALHSAVGEIRPVLLPDGSRVDLGARSALTVDFTAVQRRIALQEGEAFFSVQSDRSRPFVVSAGAVRIIALGTRFNVLRSSGRVVVSVQEGSVRVAQGARAPLVASAGHQVECDTAAGEMRTRTLDPAAAGAWREGHLEYFAEPLPNILATVNRYSGVAVLADPGVIVDLRYTGTIEVENVDEWVRALPLIFPVDVRPDGAGVRIGARQ